MNTLNFDLQLQLAGYLFKNNLAMFITLVDVNKNMYPTFLYVLRKYRYKYREVLEILAIFAVSFKNYKNLSNILTGLPVYSSHHATLLSEFMNLFLEPNISLNVFEPNLVNVLIKTDLLSTINDELEDIEDNHYIGLIIDSIITDSGNLGYTKEYLLHELIRIGKINEALKLKDDRDNPRFFDEYFDRLSYALKNKDLQLARNYTLFINAGNVLYGSDYTNLQQVANQTNDQYVINFVNDELPTLIDID